MNPQNIKVFSFLIPSYLLIVTKFLGKISQFEFLKNIFAHKLFLSLNISDFNLFFMWKLQPPPSPEKSHPLFPSKSPLKVAALSSPPFFKIWLESWPPLPLQKGGGGAHYGTYRMNYCTLENKLEVHFLVAANNFGKYEILYTLEIQYVKIWHLPCSCNQLPL